MTAGRNGRDKFQVWTHGVLATSYWVSALWLQQHSESAFFGTPCNCKHKYKYLQIVGRLGLPRGRADSAPWEFHSLSIFGLQLIPAGLHQQAVQSLLAQYKYMSSSVRPSLVIIYFTQKLWTEGYARVWRRRIEEGITIDQVNFV